MQEIFYDHLALQFSRGIPEGHRAPLADILHSDTRSVNTQTPSRDHLSSGTIYIAFFY